MPLSTAVETVVRIAVVRRLLGGEAIDPASLSAVVGLPIGTVGKALEALGATGAIYLSEGTIGAAYPLSALPTRHRVHHNGTMAHACCAIDALAVPSMVDGDATIESRCAYCNEAVTVQMRHDRILSSTPESSVVFHVARDCCDTGPTFLSRCPQINFFCGLDHLDRWRVQNAGFTGDTLTLHQAVVRAREIFAATIGLVRGGGASTADGFPLGSGGARP